MVIVLFVPNKKTLSELQVAMNIEYRQYTPQNICVLPPPGNRVISSVLFSFDQYTIVSLNYLSVSVEFSRIEKTLISRSRQSFID